MSINVPFSASQSSSVVDFDSVIISKIPKAEEIDPERILRSENFQQDLFVMERIILENIFQPKLAAYRQLPILTGTFSFFLENVSALLLFHDVCSKCCSGLF